MDTCKHCIYYVYYIYTVFIRESVIVVDDKYWSHRGGGGGEVSTGPTLSSRNFVDCIFSNSRDKLSQLEA